MGFPVLFGTAAIFIFFFGFAIGFTEVDHDTNSISGVLFGFANGLLVVAALIWTVAASVRG